MMLKWKNISIGSSRNERFRKMKNTSNLVSLCLGLFVLTACGKTTTPAATTTTTEDSSASGTVASAVGGALSSSSSSGTLAFLDQKKQPTFFSSFQSSMNFLPSALAANNCPTFKTAAGSTCTASSGTMWLTYSSCTSGASTWSGIQSITLTGGSPIVACGTFFHPIASNSIIRQFVTAASGTTPGTATTTSGVGTVTTIDHATANLGNFDTGTTIAANVGSGYGTIAGFTSGQKSSLSFAQHISAVNAAGKTLYDHSVYTSTPLTLTEASGATSRTVTGTVTLYHNLLKVVGTSTLTSVVHSDSCCHPTSGTISTTFAAGTNVSPTTAGSALVGKTEVMTFTGCGTANLTDSSGATTAVTIKRCF